MDQIKAIQNALEQSGEPVIRYRKVNGVLNALSMQIEDGGDNSAVVARLFDALEAAVGAYLSEPAAADILARVRALRQAEVQRGS
jgi:DNA-binding FrmR family transcriptional regulator